MSIGRTDAYTVHALPAWNRETYLRQAIIQWILSIGFSICESRPPTGIDPRLFLRKISLREGILLLDDWSVLSELVFLNVEKVVLFG